MADQKWVVIHQFPFVQNLQDLRILQIFRKTVHFGCFSLKHGSLVLSLQIFKKIYQKIKYLKIFKYPTPRKKLVILLQKEEEVKVVLFHLLQQHVSVELHKI